jgi:hypothetical protein
MTELFHYTCLHSAPAIKRDGLVLPLADFRPDLADLPPWAYFAWFTDLDIPHAEALGLTRSTLACDRTVCRFRVLDASPVTQWIGSFARRRSPWASRLEAVPGVLPAHWWLAAGPVKVKAA